MARAMTLLAVTLTVLTANSFAGILYLEVPEDITADMVQNPSAEDEVVIEDFVISEVNKIDKGWGGL